MHRSYVIILVQENVDGSIFLMKSRRWELQFWVLSSVFYLGITVKTECNFSASFLKHHNCVCTDLISLVICSTLFLALTSDFSDLGLVPRKV